MRSNQTMRCGNYCIPQMCLGKSNNHARLSSSLPPKTIHSFCCNSKPQPSALSNKGVSLPCCAADLPTRESKRQQLRGQGTASASASASAVRKGLVIPKKKWWAPRTGKDRDGRAKKHCTSGREERHPPIMPPYFTLYSLGHLLSKKRRRRRRKTL